MRRLSLTLGHDDKPSQLRSVFAKLDRADTHFDKLRRAIEGFLEERPYSIVSEVDRQTGECVFTGQVRKPHRVIDLGLLIGDVVQNMRNSLDHLAWQLALRHRPNDEPPGNTAFPIFKGPDEFERQVVCGRRSPIRGTSKIAQDRIAGLQPCYRAKRPWSDPLWVLHRLANDDKHRVLHVTAVAAHAATYFLSDMLATRIEAASVSVLGRSFGDGDELGRLPPEPACAELADKLNLTYDVAFDPEGPARGERVLAQLDRCRKAVREDVVPSFLDLF